jgi:hypothetical protein
MILSQVTLIDSNKLWNTYYSTIDKTKIISKYTLSQVKKINIQLNPLNEDK